MSRRYADSGRSRAPPPDAPNLRVKGCANKMISGIVTGRYVPHSSNHGKTVWRRDIRERDSEVLVYFWDDRDGPELAGWWFGPVVGGDQVWAYHPSRSSTVPPDSDWNVPHDGPIDPSFRVIKESDKEDLRRSDKEDSRRPVDRREADDLKQVEELKKKMEEHKRNEEEIQRKIAEKEKAKSQSDAVQQFKEKLLARAMKSKGTDRSSNQDSSAPDRRSGNNDIRSRSPLGRGKGGRPGQGPGRDSRSPQDRGRRDGAPRRREEENWRDKQERRRAEERKAKEDERRRAEDERDRQRTGRRKEDDDARKDVDDRRDRERRRREEEDRRRQPDSDQRRRDDEPRRREDKEQQERDEKKREQERKAKEDERRKHEEELERKRAARRAEEEEARKKVEEERRRERERRQKEEDELREKERQRREVEERQRAEQERQQEEERLRTAAEQQAAVQVLQVLQRLSQASPGSFEELKIELKEVLAEQLPKCGRQAEALKGEAERVVQYVEKYMEQLQVHQQQMEEMRKVKEKEMQQKEIKTQQLLSELNELVLDAEDGAVEAFEQSACLEVEHKDLTALLKTVKEFETRAQAAMATCVKCADFMIDRRGEMDEAERLAPDVAEYMQNATPRVQGSTRVVASVTKKCSLVKQKAVRKWRAMKATEAQEMLFKKYDKDGDGVLNKMEVHDFSKGEYDFELPQEVVDRFFERQLGFTAMGVTLKQFLQLKTAIGVARCETRFRQKRFEQEEKLRLEKEAEEAKRQACYRRKEELAPELEELQTVFKTLEGNVRSLDVILKELGNADNSMAEELMAQLEQAKQALATMDLAMQLARQTKELFLHTVEATEGLKDILQTEVVPLSKIIMAAEQTRSRAKVLLDHLDSLLKLKACVDSEALRMDVAMRIRSCAEEHGIQLKNLFGVMARERSDFVSKADIIGFLDGYGGTLSAEELDGAFDFVKRIPRAFCDDPAARSVPDGETQKAILAAREKGETAQPEAAAAPPSSELEATKMEEEPPAKVETETPAASSTPGEAAKQEEETAKASDTADALGEKESSQAASNGDAPAPSVEDQQAVAESTAENAAPAKKEPANPVEDVVTAGMLSKDEFNKLLRLHYRVVRQIILSDSLAIQESRQLRRVDIGEVMEVHEGPKMDPVVGVMRVYGCILKDGMMGWATISGNQGIVFLVRGGTAFKVLRNIHLNKELKDVEESTAIRVLKVGEVLEVIDWARTSRSALGVSRVCIRCQEDGLVGWCTLFDSGGQANLEVLA